MSCRLCCNKRENRMKRSADYASLQTQRAKMLKNSEVKFSPVKVGDDVRTCIPNVERARGESGSALQLS